MSEKKRVYIVATPFFPTPDSYRGCFVYDAVQAIERDRRYHVEVFVPKRLGDKRQGYDVDGQHVHLFPMVQMPSYFFNGLTNGFNGRLFTKAVIQAGINPSYVAVCHAHTSVFGALALALKRLNPDIKTLLQHHDPDPYTIRNGYFASWKPNLRFRANAARKIFEKTDIHVCISKPVEWNLRYFPSQNSNFTLDSYNSKLYKLKGFPSTHINRTDVLYNGVNTRIFNSRTRIVNNDVFTIGCIGNFIDWKEQLTLLGSLHILKQRGIRFKAHLIGDGPLYETCRTRSEELELSTHVTFRPGLPHTALADFYRSLDLFVLPSVFEGFGCVYTEAWSCGTPFIACQGQGIADYIYPEDAHLWLARPHDAKDLANKIEYYMINRPQQRLCHPVNIDVLTKDFLNKLQ